MSDLKKIVVLAIVALGFVVFFAYTVLFKGEPENTPIACTQEAKQCPDGSYVGRTGPNCEFAKCPIEKEEDTPQDTGEQGGKPGTSSNLPPDSDAGMEFPTLE